MKPTNNPAWNKEYVQQRLREERLAAKMKRIADTPVTVDNSAEYWFGEYMDADRRCTELMDENAKLKTMVRALLSLTPTQRTTTVTEVW